MPRQYLSMTLSARIRLPSDIAIRVTHNEGSRSSHNPASEGDLTTHTQRLFGALLAKKATGLPSPPVTTAHSGQPGADGQLSRAGAADPASTGPGTSHSTPQFASCRLPPNNPQVRVAAALLTRIHGQTSRIASLDLILGLRDPGIGPHAGPAVGKLNVHLGCMRPPQGTHGFRLFETPMLAP
jgi:hypothetical protein